MLKEPQRRRSRLERSLEGWCSNPRRDRPKSLKHVVAAPLLNAQQQVSQVLGKTIINGSCVITLYEYRKKDKHNNVLINRDFVNFVIKTI